MTDDRAHDLKPGITAAVFSDDVAFDSRQGRRTPRGSDQSDVSGNCITRFACMLTPKLDRKLAREAKRRGCSEAAVVRDLIEKGLP